MLYPLGRVIHYMSVFNKLHCSILISSYSAKKTKLYVLNLIFKDDNSKCAFVYYCFVLGGGLLLVDHCHWDILYTHST